MFVKIILIAFLIFSPMNVFSLSEKEYKLLKETSLEFLEAEKKLNNTWKMVYGEIVDIQQKNELLEKQRYWVKIGRDVVAKSYMSQGMSFSQAYTHSTLDRAKELENIKESLQFISLFKNSEKIVFYSCEQGDTLESACSSIYKKTYIIFRKDKTAVVSYGSGGENATWESTNDKVTINELSRTSEYSFVDGIYLATVSEESGDLIAYKLSQK